MKTKLLILDLDGTVRIKKGASVGESGAFIQHPEDQEIIEGARKAIAQYHADGWAIMGASNQGGVAAGKKSLENCFKEQVYTMSLVPEIEAIAFCPDYEGRKLGIVNPHRQVLLSPEGYPSFRKPGHGMVEWLRLVYAPYSKGGGFLFVGDRPEDEQAAKAGKIPFMWAKDWWVIDHE
jgi:D-glycero-D-manno-heptose 1,7-bisphosphate phosphatase